MKQNNERTRQRIEILKEQSKKLEHAFLDVSNAGTEMFVQVDKLIEAMEEFESQKPDPPVQMSFIKWTFQTPEETAREGLETCWSQPFGVLAFKLAMDKTSHPISESTALRILCRFEDMGVLKRLNRHTWTRVYVPEPNPA